MNAQSAEMAVPRRLAGIANWSHCGPSGRQIHFDKDCAMNLETLITRLDALESRAAIETLIAGYANAFDLLDAKLLGSLWHDDAALDLPGFGSAGSRDEILEMAERSWQQMPHMHHWMANPLIRIEGDVATGTVAADCLFHDIEKGPVQVSGLYYDRFERRGGHWRFASRRFELHFLTPLENWKPIAGSESFGSPAPDSPETTDRLDTPRRPNL
jgi:hypothetical protein